MKTTLHFAFAAAWITLSLATNTRAQPAKENGLDTALIPRKQVFGNPKKARARLSHDGKQLAFLAPKDGVLNVWVAPVGKLDEARVITNDTHRGIRSFSWAYTNQHVLYSNDKDGDEDFHLYCVDLKTDEIKDLTPFEKIRARINGMSEKFPDELLVGINNRPPHQLHDIYRISLLTGERKLVQENPGLAGFVCDDDFRIRFGVKYTPVGGQVYLQPVDEGWKPFLEIQPEDGLTTSLAGFDKTGDKVYLLDSRDRNTAALKLMDLTSGNIEVIAENDKADLSGAMMHPTEKHVEAVSFTYARREWQILDDKIRLDLEYLETVEDGEIQVTSRTLDDTKWTVAYLLDDGPIKFYLYDRTNQKAEFLFVSDPSIADLPLVKMHSTVIRSRDDLDLVSYLSLPANSDPDGNARPDKPLPMILSVHGGPWARDGWGYNPEHQLFANRGYAVLSVNFRGSTGFGKEFANAGNKEWAGKMHNDLLDAVNWAVEQGIAQRDKIAIMGGSYGGYATLVGLTFTPDVFACGVDIVGPSSLVTLLQNPPPYWMPIMPMMKDRVGDWETDAGKEFLESRSPLNFVDRISKPLLIIQGAKDPRVKKSEADQIVNAMTERDIPVAYMLYPQEGHGLAKPENRFAMYAAVEAFLSKHLGGVAEPIGDSFEGANVEIPVGKDQIPGI